MTKHYILHLDPNAEHPWDQCVLRNPMTGERPDLQNAIAQAVGSASGEYLIAVKIEVEVLESSTLPQSKPETRPLAIWKTPVPLAN
ncbi:hypothetical protein [Spirulina subsalsa]|uniref:hypothetical protein n=1 Tax=Spirulina subsalsa TaxID=54311 RepID=UPI00047518EF|nr:hypothetical protein [Spirulina subsalsa]